MENRSFAEVNEHGFAIWYERNPSLVRSKFREYVRCPPSSMENNRLPSGERVMQAMFLRASNGSVRDLLLL